MASVVIHDVRKSFGLTPVIHGVDIAIEDGPGGTKWKPTR